MLGAKWSGVIGAREALPLRFRVQLAPCGYVASSSAAEGVRGLLRDADEAALVGDYDQLRAVVGVQLHHRPAHVRLRGCGADHEPIGDLLVRESQGDEPEHLALSFGQLVEPLGRATVASGLGDELLDQSAGDAGGEERVAAGDDPHRLAELVGLHSLEQKPARARVHGLEHVLVELEGLK
jgi:hypothetical protein